MLIRMAVLTVAIALGGSAEPAKFTPITFETLAGQKVAAEKGEFRVPENRTKASSRTIPIRFVRFKSTAAKAGYPIVYLAGGPGGSGIGTAMTNRFQLFMSMREHGDVIAYDQRGTNESGGADVSCDEEYLITPDAPLDRVKSGAIVAGAMRKCVERMTAAGVDLGGYNTRESAADLEDLRKALGAEKLILWGISYGAHLGAAMLRYYPRSIDRVILAGIEGPDDTYKLPSDQQTLMADIARLAAGDGKHPDLLGAIAKLNRELEARPKSIALTHPLTNQTATLVLGKLDLQVALSDMLFAPDSFAGMPDFVSRLEQGDWTALGLAATRRRFGSTPSGMSVAMDCASGISNARKQRIEEEAKLTLLGDAINMPFPEVCASMNVPDAGDAFRGPVVSDVPALLISGTLDGRTRPRQAEEFRLRMPNAQHLVIENAGHSDPLFLSTPKILESMKTFLRGEPLQERYLTAPQPTFLPVRKVVAIADGVLSRYAGNYRIDDKNIRRVIKAGSVLYTHREGGQPWAVRPSSETEFFYESIPGAIRFEVKDGTTVAMIIKGADGVEQRAVKE
jgi:pimeloyl-ACP methyl ester carboxylesterase